MATAQTTGSTRFPELINARFWESKYE